MAWSGSTRAARLPGNWGSIRAAILTRDPVCRIAGSGCTVVSTEVDHIARGDLHDSQNLQGVCHTCHARKTAREAAASRVREKRKPGKHPGLL